MSLDQAAAVLGLPADSLPNSEEIARAYKKKVFENHPDRGGDPTKMVEINVAKDLLDGKSRPTYDRSGPSTPSAPSYGYTPSSDWTPPKATVTSFDEAKTKAGVPHAEWLFVTPTQRSSRGYSSDEYQKGGSAFVTYGKTDSKHVFVAASHEYWQSSVPGESRGERDIWTIRVLDFPIKGDEGKNPAWLYGNVVKAFKAIDFEGKFNSKVLDLTGKSLPFSQKLPSVSGNATSIKHWLVGSGQVGGDDASVSTRRHVVELEHAQSYTEKAGYHPEPKERWNTIDGRYTGEYHRLVLILNGKPYEISAGDFERFAKVRLGGKRLLHVIYGEYGQNSKKNLTRLKAGKAVIGWMAENFTGLPTEARDGLNQAVAQMK
jgi:hypothetical protein